MKTVLGYVFYLELNGMSFPVISKSLSQAEQFFKQVFPQEQIESKNIKHEGYNFNKDTLQKKYDEIKKTWKDLNLLNATPGSIKINRVSLDMLLENNYSILTNMD